MISNEKVMNAETVELIKIYNLILMRKSHFLSF
jgi:hypothetical protein